jgi:hypothetical protein
VCSPDSIDVPSHTFGNGHGATWYVEVTPGTYVGLCGVAAQSIAERKCSPGGWPDPHSHRSARIRAVRSGRLVRIWYVCCGVAAITANTRARKSRGTRAWNRSDMELTNTVRGLRHDMGSVSVSGCTVSAKPGPEVNGLPSFWYLGEPMALSRLAIRSA